MEGPIVAPENNKVGLDHPLICEDGSPCLSIAWMLLTCEAFPGTTVPIQDEDDDEYEGEYSKLPILADRFGIERSFFGAICRAADVSRIYIHGRYVYSAQEAGKAVAVYGLADNELLSNDLRNYLGVDLNKFKNLGVIAPARTVDNYDVYTLDDLEAVARYQDERRRVEARIKQVREEQSRKRKAERKMEERNERNRGRDRPRQYYPGPQQQASRGYERR